jgi:hypothetical protein
MRQSITSEVIGALENRRWRTKPDQVPVVGVRTTPRASRSGWHRHSLRECVPRRNGANISHIGRCLIEVKASADACPTMEQREGDELEQEA